MNIKLNEVVERSDFKVAIPLRDALESVKVPLSCPVIHPSEIILQYSIYVYIYIRLIKEVYSSFSYVFSYMKRIQNKREKDKLFDHANISKHIRNTIQIILCYVCLSIIFKKFYFLKIILDKKQRNIYSVIDTATYLDSHHCIYVEFRVQKWYI